MKSFHFISLIGTCQLIWLFVGVSPSLCQNSCDLICIKDEYYTDCFRGEILEEVYNTSYTFKKKNGEIVTYLIKDVERVKRNVPCEPPPPKPPKSTGRYGLGIEGNLNMGLLGPIMNEAGNPHYSSNFRSLDVSLVSLARVFLFEIGGSIYWDKTMAAKMALGYRIHIGGSAQKTQAFLQGTWSLNLIQISNNPKINSFQSACTSSYFCEDIQGGTSVELGAGLTHKLENFRYLIIHGGYKYEAFWGPFDLVPSPSIYLKVGILFDTGKG